MQRAYIELSGEETLRLLRKRKRMNLLVLSLLLLFVGATFALSIIHIAKETETAASTEGAPRFDHIALTGRGPRSGPY